MQLLGVSKTGSRRGAEDADGHDEEATKSTKGHEKGDAFGGALRVFGAKLLRKRTQRREGAERKKEREKVDHWFALVSASGLSAMK